ncbi:MAG: CIS tube protein, partial [Kofleriaceae bacterium]
MLKARDHSLHSLHQGKRAQEQEEKKACLTKLKIGSIDEPDLYIVAQYNPKELQYERQVPWEKAELRDNRPTWRRTGRTQTHDLEFNGAEGRTLSLELLFDGYELGVSVEAMIDALEEMATVRAPGAPETELHRPHHCVVVWGAAPEYGWTLAPRGMRPFRCVIESLAVKYTMFDP